MKFYQKEVPMPKKKRVSAQLILNAYTGEKGIKNGVVYPEYALNLHQNGGRVTGGFGLKEVFTNNPLAGYDVEEIYYYNGNGAAGELLFFASNKVYKLSLTPNADGSAPTPVFLTNKNFETNAKAVQFINEARATFLAFFTDKGVYLYNGTTLSIVSISSACIMGCRHQERLITVRKEQSYIIDFSAPYQATQWGTTALTSGRLELTPEYGDIVGVGSSEEKLLVIQRKGCSKVYLQGENYNASARPIPMSVGTIIKGSVRQMGKKLVFVTTNGVYAFDGNDVKKLCKNLNDVDTFTDMKGVDVSAFNSSYIVTYTGKDGVGRTIFVDVETGLGYVSDVVFQSSAFNGEKSYVLSNGKLCEWTKEQGGSFKKNKIWRSGLSSFRLGRGKKTLRRICLYGEGNVEMTLKNEVGESRRYAFNINGRYTVFPALRGWDYTVEITSEDNACLLEEIQLYADLFDEEVAI